VKDTGYEKPTARHMQTVDREMAGGNKSLKIGTQSVEKSTGRTIPNNLKEQLAMEEVKANPQGKTPARIPPMSDTKNGWLAKDGWVKRVQNINKVEIHYIENTRTGEKTDFKFKD
ncbi:TPA: hypothetical protein ACFB71_002080, partial [Neisseria gonorrhoeae]